MVSPPIERPPGTHFGGQTSAPEDMLTPDACQDIGAIRRTPPMPRPAASGPTARQRQILAWMVHFVAVNGAPPTVREVAEHFDLSPQTVHEMLIALEGKGFMRRAERGSRSWTPIGAPTRSGAFSRMEVSVVGVIAAGCPIEAIEDQADTVPVRKVLLRGRRGFALRVRGDSMTGAGILDGDTVVVRQQEEACDGEIVVALLGADATLKRYFRDGDHIRLEPDNPDHQTIRVSAADLRIQGVVVGVQRTLDRPNHQDKGDSRR